jgi:hypothetical protein
MVLDTVKNGLRLRATSHACSMPSNTRLEKGQQRGADGLRQITQRRRNDLQPAALRRPYVAQGTFFDDAEVALAKFRARRFRVHQPASNDDDTRIQREGEIGDVQPQRPRLKIKNLYGQRIPFLCAALERDLCLVKN